MYTHDEKKIIFTIVSRREVAILEEYIGSIDPEAFITIMDTREILGEGFRPLEAKNPAVPDEPRIINCRSNAKGIVTKEL